MTAEIKSENSGMRSGMLILDREKRSQVIILPKFFTSDTGKSPDQKMVEIETPMTGFEKARLLDIISMINGGLSITMQYLSDQFRVGAEDGRLTELLNIINDAIKIEVFYINNVVIPSWGPKNFKGVNLGKLIIRKKTGNSEEEKETENKKPVRTEFSRPIKRKKTKPGIPLNDEQKKVLEEIINSGENGIKIKGARVGSMSEGEVADILCWLMSHALIRIEGGFVKTNI